MEIPRHDVPDIAGQAANAVRQAEHRGSPVVFNLTGGTKAMSVGMYWAAHTLAAERAAAGLPPVTCCYDDLRSRQRRWWWHDDEPLVVAGERAARLLALRTAEHMAFDDITGAADPSDWGHEAEREVAQVLVDELGRALPGARPQVLRVHSVGSPGRRPTMLPPHLLVLAGTRAVAVYHHLAPESSANNNGGFDDVTFVDALVETLGGDAAKTLAVSTKEKGDIARDRLDWRWRRMSSRPFPPRVLYQGDLDALATPGFRAEIVSWVLR